jgi:hypothetical protein
MVFLNGGERERVDYFFPAGIHDLSPGEGMSFYCAFDAERFRRFSQIEVREEGGRCHRAALTGREEPAIRGEEE